MLRPQRDSIKSEDLNTTLVFIEFWPFEVRL